MESPNPKAVTTLCKGAKETSSMEETPITKVLHVASTLQTNGKDLVMRYRHVLKANEILGPSEILMLQSDDWKEMEVPIGDKRAILKAAEAQHVPSQGALSTVTTGGPAPSLYSQEQLTAIIQRLVQEWNTQPVATDSSTVKEENSSLFDEIREKTRRESFTTNSAATLRKLSQTENWYAKKFNSSLHDDLVCNVVSNLCQWALDASNNVSSNSKRDRIQDTLLLLKMHKRYEQLTKQQKGCISELTTLLSRKEGKDRRNGKSVGWLAFSDLDF
jgi:hypothetical protein